MPCRSDYLEPNERERESKLVASLLVYAQMAKGYTPTKTTLEASRMPYGNPALVDGLTAELCGLCERMTPTEKASIIYDGRKPKARELATWWEAHKLADKKREAEEAANRLRQGLRTRALAKLTPAERKALGF